MSIIMRKISLYVEEEQIAKLTAISENGSVPVPMSNQIRAAIDEFIKANARRTQGWQKHMKEPIVGCARVV